MNSNRLFIDGIYLDAPIEKGSYLNRLSAVRHLSRQGIEINSRVTFFVGENGTGKSTLTEAIAVAFGLNPEGGSRNFTFSTNDSHSTLWQHIRLSKPDIADDGFFLRAESVYNLASDIDRMDKIPAAAPSVIGGYGGVSLHKQSHGESFLALVQNRFHGGGMYILDEPEAALSPMRILTLMAEIDRLTKQNAQFIIATHSPMLIALPGARILEFSSDGICEVDYRQTEHYRVTKGFLDHPEKVLGYLLDD